MKYYPKSQIKTNLYTSGDEFILVSTREYYKGYYWSTSTGEFYTGKSPYDSPTIQLLKYNLVNNNISQNINGFQVNLGDSYYIVDELYFQAKRIPFNKTAPRYPKQYVPNPTSKDYEEGKFNRYFLKKNNELKYIEISLDECNLYINKSNTVPYEMYTPVVLLWDIISSNAYNNNYASVLKIEHLNNFYGFVYYFNNEFDKFLKK